MNTKKHETLLHNDRKPFLKNLLVFISLIFVLFSVLSEANAAELYFGAHGKEVEVGKTFEVGVFLNTQNQFINAVEGRVIFPAETAEAIDIIEGNSIISLWIERPHSVKPGEISFSGIVPGGYFGNKGYLFSLILKPKTTGSITVGTDNERILLNDGIGSRAPVVRAPISFKAVSESAVEEFLPPYDEEPPESFTPVVAKDPNIFDNQYFLAFATQDKISGIDHYEIQETRNKKPRDKGWRIGESPYLLQDQELNSYIFVKAIDKSGNERVAALRPIHPLPLYKDYRFWIIIILVALALYLLTKGRLWQRIMRVLPTGLRR